jgi:hypothetical protein
MYPQSDCWYILHGEPFKVVELHENFLPDPIVSPMYCCMTESMAEPSVFLISPLNGLPASQKGNQFHSIISNEILETIFCML